MFHPKLALRPLLAIRHRPTVLHNKILTRTQRLRRFQYPFEPGTFSKANPPRERTVPPIASNPKTDFESLEICELLQGFAADLPVLLHPRVAVVSKVPLEWRAVDSEGEETNERHALWKNPPAEGGQDVGLRVVEGVVLIENRDALAIAACKVSVDTVRRIVLPCLASQAAY